MEEDQPLLSTPKDLSSPEKSCTTSSLYTIVLTWSNISLKLKTPQKQNLHILKNLSGYANPGETLAILGASGSGKTSFLSILANNYDSDPGSKVSGKVYLNGVERKELKTANFVSFLQQETILYPSLTVRETLEFNIRIKTRNDVKKIKEKSLKILKLMRLEKVADSVVGNQRIRGISGGEKKRLCIGLLMVCNPKVLIMDEPTSGLDSFLCGSMIEIFEKLKRKGKTIVFSIHQPSSSIFKKIDRLIVMSEGQFVYQGPCRYSTSYFNNLNLPCPIGINPADHYMKILNIQNRNSLTQKESTLLHNLSHHYSQLDIWIGQKKFSPSDPSFSTQIQPSGTWKTFTILTRRSFINLFRNPKLLEYKIVQAIIYGLLGNALYYNLGYNQQAMEDRKNMLVYFTYASVSLVYHTQVILIPSEWLIVKKESSEGLYTMSSYLLSKIIVELPLQLAFITIFSLMLYFTTNLNHDSPSKYFILLGVCYLGCVFGLVLGYAVGAVVPNREAALAAGAMFIIPFIMYSGMITSNSSKHKAFAWFKYVSPYYHTLEALILNEFTDLNYDKDVKPEPKDRFDMEGEIGVHALIVACSSVGLFVCVVGLLNIKLNRSNNLS